MAYFVRLDCLKGAAFCALALACAWPAAAQEAQPAAPAREPTALPGIPDIDFSLPGRQAENPGTPTEGRSLRPAPEPTANQPTAPERTTPVPAATPSARTAASEAPRERAVAGQAQSGQPIPRRDAADRAASAEAETPLTEAAPSPGSERTPATIGPELSGNPASESASEDSSGIPAWPFGVALLAAALWFAFRRRRTNDRDGELREAEQVAPATHKPEPRAAVAAPVRTPLPASEPAAAEPVRPAPPAPPRAPAGTEPAEAAPAHGPEAHPALRVKVADLARRAAPEAPPPPPPSQPAFTRYDAFGRPLAAQPKAPPPPPAPPARPKPRIVRYDAMGLPIRD